MTSPTKKTPESQKTKSVEPNAPVKPKTSYKLPIEMKSAKKLDFNFIQMS